MDKNTEQNKNIYENQDKRVKNRFDYIVKTAKEQRTDEFFGFKWTLKAIFISVIFLGIIYYFAEAKKNPHLITVNQVIKKTGLRSKWMTLMGNKNILCLGVDSNGRMADPFFGTRSDTIIIASIDKYGNSVNLVSIPRDSKVFLPKGQGTDKINAAHAIGGPELAVETVEETFGIDINNYVVVNYTGVKEFIKTLGGVPINVEKRMYYRDRTAGLTIDLQPGYHILDADDAEGYLRFRHDAKGDIGRIKRQQWFLRALLKKLKSGETLLKTPELVEILSKNIKTDLNLFEISKLLKIAGKIEADDIKAATLPGKPSKYGPVSYWILDAEKTQQIIDRLIYREKPDKDKKKLSVTLFYPPILTEEIDNIIEHINSLGFSVKFHSREYNHYSQIVAHTERAAFSKVNLLRKSIPQLSNSHYVVEPDENLYPCTDFTIILGAR